MDLIIIEGEKGKSEYTFWYSAIKHPRGSVEIYPMGSVSYLKGVLIPIVNTKKYANILILIDTTAYHKVVLEADKFIKKVVQYSYRNHLNIRISRAAYYCFEDCFLMFRNIKYWLYPKSARYSKIHFNQSGSDMFKVLDNYLSLGSGNINSDNDYAWSRNRVLREYIMLRTGLPYAKDLSKEQLAYYILKDLTYHTRFVIDKGHISDCWMCNCKNKMECSISKQLCNVPVGYKERVLRGIECGLWRNKKETLTKLDELFKYSSVLSDVVIKMISV